jgi:ELWxxDGT repeat protein
MMMVQLLLLLVLSSSLFREFAAVDTESLHLLHLSGAELPWSMLEDGSHPLSLELESGEDWDRELPLNMTIRAMRGSIISVNDLEGAEVAIAGTTSIGINDIFAASYYKPPVNWNSYSGEVDILSISVSLAEGGGEVLLSRSFPVVVSAVNDAPSVVAPAFLTTAEDVPLLLEAISIGDVDAGESLGGVLEVNITASSGLLQLGDVPGLRIAQEEENFILMYGGLSDLNLALHMIRYSGRLDWSGEDVLTVSISDLGNTGEGGPLSAAASVNITVEAVNDPPSISGSRNIVVMYEDAELVTLGEGLQILDPDMDPMGVMRLAATASHGVLRFPLSFSGVKYLSGDDDGDTSHEFHVNYGQLEGFLAGMVYVPDENANAVSIGLVNVGISVSDLGCCGAGEQRTATFEYAVKLLPVNDAPVIGTGGPYSAREDEELSFSNLVLDDVDAMERRGSYMGVNLTVSHGFIRIANFSGLWLTEERIGFVSFLGSLESANSALSSLRYLGRPGWSGADSLLIEVSDLGNTGEGGELRSSGNCTILIEPAYDPPVVSSPPLLTVANGALLSLGEVLSFQHREETSSWAKYTFALAVDEGSLQVVPGEWPASVIETGATDKSLVFISTLKLAGVALSAVLYVPSHGQQRIDFLHVEVRDSMAEGEDIVSHLVPIRVDLEESPPTMVAPSSLNVSPSVATLIPGVQISDEQLDNGASALYQVLVSCEEGILALQRPPVVYGVALQPQGDPGRLEVGKATKGYRSFLLTGALVPVNAALAQLVYRSNLSGAEGDEISFLISRGSLKASFSIPVSVSSVPPSVTLIMPTVARLVEDEPGLVLSPANITVAGQLPFPAVLHAIISTSVGSFILPSSDSVAVAYAQGPPFSASISALRDGMVDIIAALVFLPPANWYGLAEVYVSVAWSDSEIKGSGEDSQSSVEWTTAVLVQPVNDAPQVELPNLITGSEDELTTISGCSIADVDAGDTSAAVVEVNLSASLGEIMLGTTVGLWVLQQTESSVLFMGHLDSVNAALSALSFAAPSDWSGSVELTVSVNDLGNVGSGGALSATVSCNIIISAVNDRPNIIAPVDTVVLTSSGDDSLGLSVSGISVSDVDSENISVSLTAVHGSLSLSGGSFEGASLGHDGQQMVIEGSVDGVNDALGGLVYAPTRGWTGSDWITISATDTPLGGDVTPSSATVELDVVNISSRPAIEWTTPDLTAALSLQKGEQKSFQGLVDIISDGAGGLLTLSIGAVFGTIGIKTGSIVGLQRLHDVSTPAQLVLRGTMDELNRGLLGVYYEGPKSQSGNDLLTFTLVDSLESAVSIEGEVAADIANELPSISYPSEPVLFAFEDSIVQLGSAAGLTVAGTESGAIYVNLTASRGILKPDLDEVPDNLEFLYGVEPSMGESLLVIRGSLSSVNIALAAVVYVPAENDSGIVRIVVFAADETGAAGVEQEMHIILQSVNDAPVVLHPDGPHYIHDEQVVWESSGLLSIDIGGVILVEDADISDVVCERDIQGQEGRRMLSVGLSSSLGTLSLRDAASLEVVAGEQGAPLALRGSQLSINSALSMLRLSLSGSPLPAAPIMIDVDVRDEGNCGSGGEQSSHGQIEVVLRLGLPPPVLYLSHPLDGLPGSDIDVFSKGASVALVTSKAEGIALPAISVKPGDNDMRVALGVSLQITNGIIITPDIPAGSSVSVEVETPLEATGSSSKMYFRGAAQELVSFFQYGALVFKPSSTGLWQHLTLNHTATPILHPLDPALCKVEIAVRDPRGHISVTATVRINVISMNNPPRLSGPDSLIAFAGQPIPVLGISVDDEDTVDSITGKGWLQISMWADGGELLVPADSIIAAGVEDYSQPRVIILRGLSDRLNYVLSSVTYLGQNVTDDSGAIHITVVDAGYGGDGGPQLATRDIPVTISPLPSQSVSVVLAGDSSSLVTTYEDSGVKLPFAGIEDDLDRVDYTLSIAAKHGRLLLGPGAEELQMRDLPRKMYNLKVSSSILPDNNTGEKRIKEVQRVRLQRGWQHEVQELDIVAPGLVEVADVFIHFPCTTEPMVSNITIGVSLADPLGAAVDFKAALESLPCIGEVEVERILVDAASDVKVRMRITFLAASGDIPLLVVDSYDVQPAEGADVIVREVVAGSMQSEVQRLTLISEGKIPINSGTMRLRLKESITDPVPFNATAEELAVAICSASTPGAVTVSREEVFLLDAALLSWDITFQAWAGDLPNIEPVLASEGCDDCDAFSSADNETSANVSISIVELRPGSPDWKEEIFTLLYEGFHGQKILQTDPLPIYASSSMVEKALEMMETVHAVTVVPLKRTGLDPPGWEVTFDDPMGNVPALRSDNPAVIVSTVTDGVAPLDGSFSVLVSVPGRATVTTSQLPVTASPGAVLNALQAACGVPEEDYGSDLSVVQLHRGSWRVENVPPEISLAPGSSNLLGSGANLEVSLLPSADALTNYDGSTQVVVLTAPLMEEALEIQQLSCLGEGDGTFTISVGLEESESIDVHAPASAVEAALERMGYGPVSLGDLSNPICSASGSVNLVTFSIAGDVPPMIVNATPANDSSPISMDVLEVSKGVANYVSEIQRVTLSSNMQGGSFTLLVGPEATPTPALSWDATEAEVMEALGGITHVHSVSRVLPEAGQGMSWVITFDALAGPIPLLQSNCLAGGTAQTYDIALDAVGNYSIPISISRLMRGSLPVSGSLVLRVWDTESDASATLPALSFYARDEDVAGAFAVISDWDATVAVQIAPHPAAHGALWDLRSDRPLKIEVHESTLQSRQVLCAGSSSAPTCDFPVLSPQSSDPELQAAFFCELSSGGWCSSVATGETGFCTPCADYEIPPPTVHVCSPQQSIELRGTAASLATAVSDVIYWPAKHWNSEQWGHDVVTANGVAVTINVLAVNDPPTIFAPPSIVAFEGQEVKVAGLFIGDADLERDYRGPGGSAAGGPLEVNLHVQRGTLALQNTAGLTFIEGTPAEHRHSAISLRGDLQTLQNALEFVYYRPFPPDTPISYEVQHVEAAISSSRVAQQIAADPTSVHSYILSLSCVEFAPPDGAGNFSTSTLAPLSVNATAEEVEVAVNRALLECISDADEMWNEAYNSTHLNVASPYNHSIALVRSVSDWPVRTWEVVFLQSPALLRPMEVEHVTYMGDYTDSSSAVVVKAMPVDRSLGSPFVLHFEGQPSEPITGLSGAEDMKRALAGVIDVQVTALPGPSWLITFNSPGDFSLLTSNVSWISTSEIVAGQGPHDELVISVRDTDGGIEEDNQARAIIPISIEASVSAPDVYILGLKGSQGQQIWVERRQAGSLAISGIAIDVPPFMGMEIVSVNVTTSRGTPGISPLHRLSVLRDSGFLSFETVTSERLSLIGTAADVNAALERLQWAPPARFGGSWGKIHTSSVEVEASFLRFPQFLSQSSAVLFIEGGLSPPRLQSPIEFVATAGVEMAITGLSLYDTDPFGFAFNWEALDILNGEYTVSASATYGSVQLPAVSSSGSASSISADTTVTGVFSVRVSSKNDVDRVLAGLSYEAPYSYSGSDLVMVTVAHRASGFRATGSVSVVVTASDSSDIIILAGGIFRNPSGAPAQVPEDTPTLLGIGSIVLESPESSHDPPGSPSVTVTMEASTGSLALERHSPYIRYDGLDSGGLKIEGELQSVNEVLPWVVYSTPLNMEGLDELRVRVYVTDTGDGVGVSVNGKIVQTTLPIIVTPVNDPPVIIVPPARLRGEQGRAMSLPITVEDPDADDLSGSRLISIHIEVESSGATVSLANMRGLPLHFAVGGGDASYSELQFKATLSHASAGLSGLTFLADTPGEHRVKISVDDGGNFGSGGTKSAQAMLSILVEPSILEPSWILPPGSLIADENGVLIISGVNFKAGSTSARYGVQVTLESSGGGALSILSSIRARDVDILFQDGLLTLSGVSSAVEAALGIIEYRPATNFHGMDSIKLSAAVDPLTSGDRSSGVHSAAAQTTLQVYVVPADDAPKLSASSTWSAVAVIGGPAIPLPEVIISSPNVTSSASEEVGGSFVTIYIASEHGFLEVEDVPGLWIRRSLTAEVPEHSPVSEDGALVLSGSPEGISAAFVGGKVLYTPPLETPAGSGNHTGDTIMLWWGKGEDMKTISVELAPPMLLVGVQWHGDQHIMETDEDIAFMLSSLTILGPPELDSVSVSMAVVRGDGVVNVPRLSSGLLNANILIEGSGTAQASMAGSMLAVRAALQGALLVPAPFFSGGLELLVSASATDRKHLPSAENDLTLRVLVMPVNNAPVIHAPGASTDLQTPEDTELAIGRTGIFVTDPDVYDSLGGMMSIAVNTSSGQLSVDSSFVTSEVSLLRSSTGSSLNITGPLNGVNEALEGLLFSPDADMAGTSKIVLIADDLGNTGSGGARQTMLTLHVSVRATDDEPHLLAPLEISGTEGHAVPLHVQLEDVDALPTDMITLWIDVTEGNIFFADATDVLLVHEDRSLLVSGTIAGVQAALSSAQYLREGSGSSLLSLSVDRASLNSTHRYVDPLDMVIIISPVNQAPEIVAPASYVASEDEALILSGISVTDADTKFSPPGTPQEFSASFVVTKGLVFLNRWPPGVSPGAGSYNNSAGPVDLRNPATSLVFTGTLDAVNSALQEVSYVSSRNMWGTDSIEVNLSDGGFYGEGPALSTKALIVIDVEPINDAPVISAPTEVRGSVDTGGDGDWEWIQVPDVIIVDVDSEEDNSPLTLSIETFCYDCEAQVWISVEEVMGEVVLLSADGTVKSSPASLAPALSLHGLVESLNLALKTLMFSGLAGSSGISMHARDDQGASHSVTIALATSSNDEATSHAVRPVLSLGIEKISSIMENQAALVGKESSITIQDAKAPRSSGGSSVVRVDVLSRHGAALEVQRIRTSAKHRDIQQRITIRNFGTEGGEFILSLDLSGLCPACGNENTLPIEYDAAATGSAESVAHRLASLAGLLSMRVAVHAIEENVQLSSRDVVVVFSDAPWALPKLEVVSSVGGEVVTTIDVTANRVSGTFSLALGGAKSGDIRADADPADIAALLAVLPGVHAVEVSSVLEDFEGGHEWLVSFVHVDAGGDIPLLYADGAGLSGIDVDVDVHEVHQGIGLPEIWTVSTLAAAHMALVIELQIEYVADSSPGHVSLIFEDSKLGAIERSGRIYATSVGSRGEETMGHSGLPGTSFDESVESVIAAVKAVSDSIAVNVTRVADTSMNIFTTVVWHIVLDNVPSDFIVPALDSDGLGSGATASLNIISAHEAISGTFSLSVVAGGISTLPLNVESTALEVEEALNSVLSSLGGLVKVTRSTGRTLEGGYVWHIAFLSEPRGGSISLEVLLPNIGGGGRVVAELARRRADPSSVLSLSSWGSGMSVEGATRVDPYGVGGPSLTLTGTVEDITDSLRTLEYRPPEAWYGNVSIDFVATTTYGGVLDAGAFLAPSTLSLVVEPQDDSLRVAWCGINILESQAAAFVDEDAFISFEEYDCLGSGADADSWSISKMQQELSRNFDHTEVESAGPVLYFSAPSSGFFILYEMKIGVMHGSLLISGSGEFGPARELTVSGSAAYLNTVMNLVSYAPDDNFSGSDLLVVSVQKDGFSFIGEVLISVAPVNDPPVILADEANFGSKKLLTGLTDAAVETEYVYVVRVLEDESARPFVGLSVSDADIDLGSRYPAYSPTHIMISCEHCTLSIPLDLIGKYAILDPVEGDNARTVSFQATLEVINAMLPEVLYTGTENWNGIDRVSVVVEDARLYGKSGADSLLDRVTVAIVVEAVNDPPQIYFPESQGTGLDHPLAAIRHLRVTEDRVGLVGEEEWSATMQVEVSATALGIPTYLNNLVEGGWAQGEIEGISSSSIHIHDPDTSAPESGWQSYSVEGITPSAAFPTDILIVKIEVLHGTLTLSTTAGVHVIEGSGFMDAYVEITGPEWAVNRALTGAGFLSDRNWNSGMAQFGDTEPALISLTVQDSLGSISKSAIQLEVVPENDLPVIILPPALGIYDPIQLEADGLSPLLSAAASLEVQEGQIFVFEGVSLRDVDIHESIIAHSLPKDDLSHPGLLEVTIFATMGEVMLDPSATVSMPLGSLMEWSSSIQFRASPEHATSALDSLKYTGGPNRWGIDSIVLTVSDLGNVGLCSANKKQCSRIRSVTIPVDVQQVPSPPSISLPGNGFLWVTEDSDIVLSGLNVTDWNEDGGLGSLGAIAVVRVTTEHGEISLRTFEDIEWPEGGPIIGALGAGGLSSFTLSGTVASVNAALDGSIYRPQPNWNTRGRAADIISISASTFQSANGTDLGWGSSVLRIEVAPVNDDPVILLGSTHVSTPEDVPLALPITVNDIDLKETFAGVLRVRVIPEIGAVLLGSYSGLQDLAQLAGEHHHIDVQGSQGALNSALAGLLYIPEENMNGQTAISVEAWDEEGGTAAVTILIDVLSVEDDPIWALPSFPVFVAEDEAIALAAYISLDDPDAASSELTRVTISVIQGALVLAVPPSSVSLHVEHMSSFGDPGFAMHSDLHNGTWSRYLEMAGSTSDLQEALKSLIYMPPMDWSSSGGRGFDVISLLAEDLGPLGSGLGFGDILLYVGARENDPPQVIPPGAVLEAVPCELANGGSASGLCTRVISVDILSVEEDTPRYLHGLAVLDPDSMESQAAVMEVTLSASHGRLSCNACSKRSGSGTHTVLIRGSLAQVNVALSTMIYNPDLDWSGADSIEITANDQGFTGTGGPRVDSQTIPVIVSPTPDPPIILFGSTETMGVMEDTRAWLPEVVLLDADSDAPRLHSTVMPSSPPPSLTLASDYPLGDPFMDVKISASHGRILLPTAKGLDFVLPAPGNDSYMSGDGSRGAASSLLWWRAVSYRGRLSDASSSLDGIAYLPDANWHGTDVIVFETSDAEAASVSSAKQLGVRVFPVPDPPVLSVAGEIYDDALSSVDGLSPLAIGMSTMFGAEDTPLPIKFLSPAVRDVDFDGFKGAAPLILLFEALRGTPEIDEATEGIAVLNRGSEGAEGITWLKIGCRGSLAASAALETLMFLPSTDSSGSGASLSITATSDSGLFDQRVIPIAIRPVNDAPVIVFPPPEAPLVTVEEGGTVRLAEALFKLPDVSAASRNALEPSLLSRSGYELWRSVGAAPKVDSGPWGDSSSFQYEADLVKDINSGLSSSHPRYMTAWRGAIYFAAESREHGNELWRTDGSAAGTVLVSDIFPGPFGSSPSHMVPWGSHLYFQATGVDTSWMIGKWRADDCAGFRASTVDPTIHFAVADNTTWVPGQLYDCPPGYHWANTAEGKDLFRSRYNDDNHGSGDLTYAGQCGWNNLEWGGQERLYFRFSDSHLTGAYKHAGKSEQFRPDLDDPSFGGGSPLLSVDRFAGVICVETSRTAGTRPPCRVGERPSSLHDCHEETGAELWRTDGSASGTQRVLDLRSGPGGAEPSFLTPFGSALFFAAGNIELGTELFAYTLTGEVVCIADVNDGHDSSTPMHLTAAGQMLFFSADDGVYGRELWVTNGDGIQSFDVSGGHGTRLAHDISPGPSGSTPESLTWDSTSSTLFFTADNGISGRELWSAHAMGNGAELVSDICPGTRSSNPRHLTPWGGKLYFQADDCTHGTEIWVVHEGRATLLVDIRPGAGGSRPSYFTPFRSGLYFLAAGGESDVLESAGLKGYQLWRSDGSASGTLPVFSHSTSYGTITPDWDAMDTTGLMPSVELGVEEGTESILLIAGTRDELLATEILIPHNEAFAEGLRQAFALYDVDTPASIKMTLSCDKCGIFIGESRGLDINTYSGVEILGDGSLWSKEGEASFVGSVAAINRAMRDLRYVARGNDNGWDAIRITAEDRVLPCEGEATFVHLCDAGESHTVAGELLVYISPTNQPPQVHLPSQGVRVIGGSHGQAGFSSAIEGFYIEDQDVRESSFLRADGLRLEGPISLRITANLGTVSLGLLDPLTLIEGDGLLDRDLRLAGAIDDVNIALSTLSYWCADDCQASDEDILTFTVSDNGFTGSGGDQFDSAALYIALNRVKQD